MKVIAAYLLAVLGGNLDPSSDDLKNILSSVGAEADDERIEFLLSEVEGKDITELVASGREKFASVPSGGGAIAVAAPAAGGGSGAAPTAAEPKKEEKVEEKEESDENLVCVLIVLVLSSLGFVCTEKITWKLVRVWIPVNIIFVGMLVTGMFRIWASACSTEHISMFWGLCFYQLVRARSCERRWAFDLYFIIWELNRSYLFNSDILVCGTFLCPM